MKKLFNEIEFNVAKSTDLLKCECYQCGSIFNRCKKDIKRAILGTKSDIKYCSYKCKFNAMKIRKYLYCKNCNIEIYKTNSDLKKSNTNNFFCCSSCSATYNNKNKTNGNRVSKLEIFLQDKLIGLYPNIEFHFNKKDTINSELDIYVPSLKLAFELNGIFHYEPIFGDRKLSQIQNNDDRKFQACLEKGIELCIIDVSQLKYFKETNSVKYLDIILNIINSKF